MNFDVPCNRHKIMFIDRNILYTERLLVTLTLPLRDYHHLVILARQHRCFCRLVFSAAQTPWASIYPDPPWLA